MFFDWLNSCGYDMPCNASECDDIVGEYIETCWETGVSKNDPQDVISALGHFVPQLKGKFAQSWSLISAWQKQEPPSKAWPLSSEMITGMVGHALEASDT